MDVPQLRATREHAFLSQRELAARSGLTQATIARLETGKHQARMSTIRRLAAALGVAPSDLVASVIKEETQ